MTTSSPFHPLVPGACLPGDWFPGRIPGNIVVGVDCVIDSSFCFKQFLAKERVALRLGDRVTLWRTSLAVEEGGLVVIGDCCYLANASIACAGRITIGSHVMIAGGVTIADSDFHPLAPASRLEDTVALSPIGDRTRRRPVESRPVAIGDDVWIGHNATILKGVRVGKGAVIAPGAVVVRDVESGAYAEGNPSRAVEQPEP